MRIDGRGPEDLRPIKLVSRYQKQADGSVLIQWGDTWVLCAASVADDVPPFRRESGGGWVTAEYSMLPGSTKPRKSRRTGGRESEIQRLIGRALRGAIDLQALGPYTVTIDCDVIRADGGTRVASITGGYVALALALKQMRADGRLAEDPLRYAVAAVSVGVVDDQLVLDLPYQEDVRAEVDMNVVMTSEGDFVEVQGTAEGQAFSREQLHGLTDLAARGIQKLCALQCQLLASAAAASAELMQ